MTEDEAREFIASQKWIRAKTMPHIPHEYIVRNEISGDLGYCAFFNAIQELGKPMRWGRYRRQYFDLDGYRYWAMTTDINISKIINREKISDSKATPA